MKTKTREQEIASEIKKLETQLKREAKKFTKEDNAKVHDLQCSIQELEHELQKIDSARIKARTDLAEKMLSKRIKTDLKNVAGYIHDELLKRKPKSLEELHSVLTETIGELVANESEVEALEDKEPVAKLVYKKNGKEVKLPLTVTHNGKKETIIGFREGRSEASSGRVQVRSKFGAFGYEEFYPHCYDLKIIKE